MLEIPYLIGFDTETTGIDVFEDRIVTASIVYMDPDSNIIANYEWLINPGVPIAPGATEVHGITDEKAQSEGQGAPTAIYEIAATLAHFLKVGVPVVAYNATFDFSLLNAEIRRHLDYAGFEDFFDDHTVPKLILDPLVLDKKLDQYRKGSRKLTDTANMLGVVLENAHASFDDCIAAVGVVRGLWDKYPALREAPSFDSLYDAQVGWYKDQMEGLIKHFKKVGKDWESVTTVWPIREEDSEPVQAGD